MQRVIAPTNTWRVDRKQSGYYPTTAKIHVKSLGPMVVMMFDHVRLQLTTPEAWKLAWALYKQADLCIADSNDGVLWNSDLAKDYVVLNVNGADINLPALAARKLSVSLFRRSDAVDDYQIANKVRIVR